MSDPPPKYETSAAAEPELSVPAFESHSDLVIGIDFGTTFTGVAYAHTATGDGDTSRVADNVVVLKTWPSSSNHYAEKTPTILAYNTNPPTWGGKVKVKDTPQVAHFKLGLHEEVGRHYATHSTVDTLSVLGGYLTNPNWRHPDLPSKTAVDFTADYLTCVWRHVTEKVLPSHFGPLFLQNQQVSYVLTVPAIWSEKANSLTRQAALRAGIPSRKLILISEPEAAALYCVTICKEVDLQDGDSFLVCDAGGGTVVWSRLIAIDRRTSFPTKLSRKIRSLSRNVVLAQVRLVLPFTLIKALKLSYEIV
jgi:molecular chaperone DnaK (HSP70)